MRITFEELRNEGDVRGASFTGSPALLRFVNGARDLHLATILPGHTRGNHFHQGKQEMIVVVGGTAWDFHWDEGPDDAPRHRRFDGSSAVLIRVEPGASHAITNTGNLPLTIIGISDQPYDMKNPDIVARVMTGAVERQE